MHVPAFLAVSDGGFVDEAVQGLSTSTVYVAPDSGAPAGLAEQLETEIGDASIGVAVLSQNANLEAETLDIVDELLTTTGYDTIIVAVGNDVAAGSNVLEDDEVLGIANEAQTSEESVEDALTVTVQEIVALEPATTPAEQGDGVDGGLVVGFVLTTALLVGAVIAVVAVVRRRRRSAPEQGALPDGVAAQIAVLRRLVGEYAAVGASGNGIATQTSLQIAVLADNVQELFARLDRRNVEDQVSIAAVEYDDKLRKLTAALNSDYLLDILTHPHLWDDPDDRVREVQQALEGVSTELVDNIKQVNARRGLLFQVSLDGLIGRRKELQDWDRAFGEASDGGPSAPA
ncbi:hypothetical protein ABZ477_07495 [Microbacterium sp. NPDC019599]|uniref:hypothetical protein n=1 Tax=Microbacterium sp. NPDC019599 TaxID=3154690 RepID=UPI0033D9B789